MGMTDGPVFHGSFLEGYEAGRREGERRAAQVLGKLVLSAGGEIRVPRALMLDDVVISREEIFDYDIYRAVRK